MMFYCCLFFSGEDLLYLLEQPHVPEGVVCTIPAPANYKNYQVTLFRVHCELLTIVLWCFSWITTLNPFGKDCKSTHPVMILVLVILLSRWSPVKLSQVSYFLYYI